MLKSLIVAYNRLTFQNDLPELTKPVNGLRQILVDCLKANPKQYGLGSGRQVNKLLKQLRNPGQMPIPEMLLAFAQRFEVTVCVHFGGDKPVLYKCLLEDAPRLHLQCLAGIHYNPVEESKKYNKFYHCIASCGRLLL